MDSEYLNLTDFFLAILWVEQRQTHKIAMVFNHVRLHRS